MLIQLKHGKLFIKHIFFDCKTFIVICMELGSYYNNTLFFFRNRKTFGWGCRVFDLARTDVSRRREDRSSGRRPKVDSQRKIFNQFGPRKVASGSPLQRRLEGHGSREEVRSSVRRDVQTSRRGSRKVLCVGQTICWGEKIRNKICRVNHFYRYYRTIMNIIRI